MLYLSSVLISGLVLFHCHSCQRDTICCSQFALSECCAAFHTTPNTSNEAELALPKGGFKVARCCLFETNWSEWTLFIQGIISTASSLLPFISFTTHTFLPQLNSLALPTSFSPSSTISLSFYYLSLTHTNNHTCNLGPVKLCQFHYTKGFRALWRECTRGRKPWCHYSVSLLSVL